MANTLVILTTLAALLVAHQFLPQLETSRTFQLYGEIVRRVETDEKVIALTFDDGPEPERVEEVLQMLDDEDVKATFFVVGEKLEQHPRRGKKIVAAGHELGNHSYSHQHMVFVSEDFVQKEVEETDRLIREAGYEGEILFRPPYSEKLLTLPHYLAETGRITVMWDVSPGGDPETNSDSEKITAYVLGAAKPGSIVLLHPWDSGDEEPREAIQPIIHGLKQDGYRFVTVSELLQHRSQ